MSKLIEDMYRKRQGLIQVTNDEIRHGALPTEVLLKMYELGRVYNNPAEDPLDRDNALINSAQILRNTLKMPNAEEKILRLLKWWAEGVRDYAINSRDVSVCESELLSYASMMGPLV